MYLSLYRKLPFIAFSVGYLNEDFDSSLLEIAGAMSIRAQKAAAQTTTYDRKRIRTRSDVAAHGHFHIIPVFLLLFLCCVLSAAFQVEAAL